MRKTILLLLFCITLNPMNLFARIADSFSDSLSSSVVSTMETKILSNSDIPIMGVVLVPNSTAKTVMAFDPVSGELIDQFFFPADSENLGTPLYVIWNHDGSSFLVSDQVKNVVHQFDTSGIFQQTFAPNQGANPEIMSNIRAIVLQEDGNLLVCVASGDNANSVARFDHNGNFLGNLIDNNAGGLDRPFGLLYRPDFNDYLVAANGSSGIHRYDENGEFIEMFATEIGFPQQINMASNGNILVASSTTPVGVLEYDNSGELVEQYDVVGGVRGVHELTSGNFLISTVSGVYVINRSNQLVGQMATGNARHITYLRPMDIDYYPLTLNMNPTDAGKVIDESGNFGEYPEGFAISLTAVANVFHEFENWTDKNNQVLSTQSTFDYIMPAEQMTITANFSARELYEVTFFINEDSEEELPVEGARILFDEFETLVSDHDGQVSFEFPEGSFVGHIIKEGYHNTEIAFEVSGSSFEIEIKLQDILIIPQNLSITTEGLEHGQAIITWADPSLYTEFRHDDGVSAGSLGFQSSTLNSVMGSVHHKDAVLREVAWHLDTEDAPPTTKLWILGLNEAGLPDRNNVLYVAEGIPTQEQWTSHRLPEPVEAPQGFFIGLSASSFLHLAIDDGTGEPWNFIPNTHFGVANISLPGSAFTPLENWGYEANFMIRAIGESHGELIHKNTNESVTDLSEPAPLALFNQKSNHLPDPFSFLSNKSYLGVNVFLNDMGTPIATHITATEYLLTDLSVGQHLAGVQTVYTTGVSQLSMMNFEIESNEPVVFPLPYSDDFEAYSSHQDFINHGHWTIVDGNDDGYSWYHFYDAWDKVHVLASRSFLPEQSMPLEPYDFLITPKLAIPTLEDQEDFIQLEYYVAASSTDSFSETYKVIVSVTGNQQEDFASGDIIFQETLTPSEAAWNFSRRRINLCEYQGQEIFIAFVHFDSSGNERLLIREVSARVESPLEIFEITFQVDMNQAEGFDPMQHSVYISGAFGEDMNWTEPGSSQDLTLERIGNSMIYQVLLFLTEADYEYKYFSDAFGQGFNGAEWGQETPNREIQVESDTQADDIWGVPPHTVSAPGLHKIKSGLTVFPNPASKIINVFCNDIITGIKLYNLAGQQIYSDSPQSNHYQINAEEFEPGIIFIQVISTEGIFQEKLQIIK